MKKALLLIVVLGGVFFACQKTSLTGDDITDSAGVADERGGGFGRCLRGDTTVIDSLPAGVTAYVDTTYPGATIDLVIARRHGAFAVQLSTGEVLIFNADGEFVRICDGNGGAPSDSTGTGHGPHGHGHGHGHGPWMPGDSTHVPGDSTGGHGHGPWMPGDSTHVPGDSTGGHGPHGGHGGGHGHHGHGG